MKKAILNTKTIAIALTALFVTGFTNASRASDSTRHPIEVKFIGDINSHPVFLLNINNEDVENYWITIKVADNETLYTARLSGKNLSAKYLLNLDRDDLNNIELELTNRKTNTNYTYRVSKTVSYFEGVSVARL